MSAPKRLTRKRVAAGTKVTAASSRTSPARRKAEAPTRRLESWALDRLSPDPGNPRTHTEDQVRRIAASIERFGFNNPILVGASGLIAAGHGRLAAARLLGLKTVPVLVLPDLDAAKIRRYSVADNRLAELAGWDRALLAAALEDVREDELELDAIGFDEDSLAKLLATLADPPEPGGDFTEVGDERAGDYVCPKCGHEWKGRAR